MSKPTSLLNFFCCMCKVSFTLSSICLPALSKIAVLFHITPSPHSHACSATADLLHSPLLQASKQDKTRQLPTSMQSNVVYQIPCSCGRVYVGETVRRLETRMKEHLEACKRGECSKSAVAEHAWECGEGVV